jgi:hypothetical protein
VLHQLEVTVQPRRQQHPLRRLDLVRVEVLAFDVPGLIDRQRIFGRLDLAAKGKLPALALLVGEDPTIGRSPIAAGHLILPPIEMFDRHLDLAAALCDSF